MRVRIGIILLAIQTSCALATTPRPQSSEDVSARLRTRVHDYNLSAVNFVEALAHVGSEFHIPMGIVWVNTPEARAKLSLSWKDAKVREIIEAIAKTQPGSVVEVREGVVHVHPLKSIPDRQNFVKLRIKGFEVRNEVVELASRRLHDLVRSTVFPQAAPERRGGIGGSLGANAGDPKITVQLRNVTVEDVLDTLAVASARKIWIVTYSADPTLTGTGFRRTLTLWNTFPIPDEAQPLWDLLHWGEAIPTAVLGEK